MPLCVLSGFSLMNSTAIRARNAKGTPIRKTSAVATPYACSTISRAGSGSLERSGTPWPAPPLSAAPPKPLAISLATRWLSTAPSALVPIAPPRLRKNDSTEVAAPSSEAGTSFWAARTRFCISMPTPTPSTTM